MMQLKLVLAEVLRKYEVTSAVPEEELNLLSELVLNNKEGIRIGLRKRKS